VGKGNHEDGFDTGLKSWCKNPPAFARFIEDVLEMHHLGTPDEEDCDDGD